MKNNLMVVVDVEADGPCPGLFSMVSFAAIVAEPRLDRVFFARTAPISPAWIPEALSVSGVTREEHLTYPDPSDTMSLFREWLLGLETDRLIFVSDNPAFDWQWINYYFHAYSHQNIVEKRNPFGHSARRIGDIYSGFTRKLNDTKTWKKWRQTKHTHDPIDDARGNAEAFVKIMGMIGS